MFHRDVNATAMPSFRLETEISLTSPDLAIFQAHKLQPRHPYFINNYLIHSLSHTDVSSFNVGTHERISFMTD